MAVDFAGFTGLTFDLRDFVMIVMAFIIYSAFAKVGDLRSEVASLKHDVADFKREVAILNARLIDCLGSRDVTVDIDDADDGLR